MPRSNATVIAALDEDEPKSPRDLQAATGLSISAVYAALKTLAANELAAKDTAGGWLRRTDWETKLDAIAQRLGTARATTRQHELHALERYAHQRLFGTTKKSVNPETGEISTVKTLGSWKGKKTAPTEANPAEARVEQRAVS